jgi:2-amino-4-hydroxy-6-hydroxymethyldihydropteridine diphosphokinase
MKKRALLGLGSSLGDRRYYLMLAIVSLHHHQKISVLKLSSIWGSLPLGEAAKNVFYNMVIEIETELSPAELLMTIIEMEEFLGRKRCVRWSDRTIDIDILLYENQVISSATLSVPHPEMLFRGFVIEPLLEIAPDWQYPEDKRRFRDMEMVSFLGLWKIGILSLPISLSWNILPTNNPKV